MSVMRWEVQVAPGRSPIELADDDVSAWILTQHNMGTLATARFRRRFEQRWLTVEESLARYYAERGATMGARVGAALATFAGAPGLLLAVGGTLTQAITLMVALAIGGGVGLIRQGPDAVVRLVSLQSAVLAVLTVGHLGLFGTVVASIHLPLIVMVGAVYAGSRVGRATGGFARARALRALGQAGYEPTSAGSDRAVAA